MTRTNEVETTSTQKCVEDQLALCALPRVVGAATLDVLVDEQQKFLILYFHE
jgi:hypothetical protein